MEYATKINVLLYIAKDKTKMKTNLLLKNTYMSLLYQAVTVICGFILPRLILTHYGTTVNGLVNSITQFLGLITYLDLGISAVVQSALYKPLADKDNLEISKIISSARRFFKLIAKILVLYVVVPIFAYPYLLKGYAFEFTYVASLIMVISISSFAEYYFGITDQLLISADQKVYIPYLLQIITLVINTAVCAILMNMGYGIQIVKLTTVLIFLARPIFYRIYVNKYYTIDRNAYYDSEPIKQKWNGIAQHVAAVVLGGTDTIILTLFSSLQNVSIYGVYFLVINGVQKIFVSGTTGYQAFYGNLWARGETEKLSKSFSTLIWGIHTSVVLIFACVAILIVPFVKVYTYGINDADYDVPLFAFLITMAYAFYCLRLPYNLMVLAGNHYRQTQKSYIIATLLNVVISIVTVKQYGLIGVAIGTLVSMLYQTIWMAWYNSKNLIQWPMNKFFKQIVVDTISAITIILVTSQFVMQDITYLGWVILAVKVTICAMSIEFLINYLFYSDYMFMILKRILRKQK